jgi:hypothetical protein
MARTGMPDGLIRRTMPPERNGDSTEASVDSEASSEANGEANGESRGGLPAKSKTRTRAKKAPAGGPVRGRKLQLPDSVFERLSLHAIKKRSNASTIAAEILDKNLPKHRIETDD